MADIDKLLEIMIRLRDPVGGCPWDVRQDFSGVAPYTIEEAYEVADAIASDNMEALCGELGDLLFQVVFHAQIAAERRAFDFADVTEAICEKMIRRHPHVFGSVEERAAGAPSGAWERIKKTERQAQPVEGKSVLDDVARALPALKRAEKLGKRAAAVGFDWPNIDGAREKLHEELSELAEAVLTSDQDAVDEELGDVLFSLVNIARHLHVDPEDALRRANGKFERRFRSVESLSARNGHSVEDADLETMESYWQASKEGD